MEGVWLKTMVFKTNCSKPPPGHGWGDVGSPGNIALFEEAQPQRWVWRSLVAAGNESSGAEGANENDMAVLDDGTLIVIFRRDGGDGWPDHAHRSYMKVLSFNAGRDWTKPEALPEDVLSARPQLLKLPRGPLLLTGGRPKLMMWVSADGRGQSWAPYNLAAEHNRGLAPDSPARFCDGFANGTADWLESTCYTSLQRVADGPSGAQRVLVCYDRMGTEPPAAPPECQPDRVETFCMRVSINA